MRPIWFPSFKFLEAHLQWMHRRARLIVTRFLCTELRIRRPYAFNYEKNRTASHLQFKICAPSLAPSGWLHPIKVEGQKANRESPPARREALLPIPLGRPALPLGRQWRRDHSLCRIHALLCLAHSDPAGGGAVSPRRRGHHGDRRRRITCARRVAGGGWRLERWCGRPRQAICSDDTSTQ